MDKSIKFLGVCILIGCILLSFSWIVTTYYSVSNNRYSIVDAADSVPTVLDKKTGDSYYIFNPNSTYLPKKVPLPK